MSQNNIVVVKDLEKKYKSGTHAVKGINFEVKKGEVFAIIGPNGAGKSSMLNVINGFYKPTSIFFVII